jgi:L-asparaginase II
MKYTKPVIVAKSGQDGVFAAGCATRGGGIQCNTCRSN